VRPAVQQALDAVSDAPAWVRNDRHDILAMNRLGLALYAPVLADPRRPAYTTRFVYLDRPCGSSSWTGTASPTTPPRCCASRPAAPPHDRKLIALVGELSTQSEIFRKRWASHDVQYHRSGQKRLRHPVVGQLDLNFESMELSSEPGLTLNIYTAAPDTPAADGLTMLASWAATQDLAEASLASDKS
jgi:hypothetical protein